MSATFVPAIVGGTARAEENIEWVAEHLPEIAMDNRYASLPLWNTCDEGSDDDGDDQTDRPFCFATGAAYARTHSGSLSMDGPMLTLGFVRPVGEEFKLTGFLFFDDLAFAGDIERRPLDITFATPPIALPVDAEFTNLDGNARDIGFGMALNGSASWTWFPSFEWSAGFLWQRIELSKYRFDYVVTRGSDTGTRGTLDYSATYTHISPFLGAAWPVVRGAWRYTPHFQLAMPLPRRAVEGRITGPEFDLAGNASDTGTGKHFGDPSVTIGFDITYEPWDLTIDLGSTITQAILEPRIHEGVKRNFMLTGYWTL